MRRETRPPGSRPSRRAARGRDASSCDERASGDGDEDANHGRKYRTTRAPQAARCDAPSSAATPTPPSAGVAPYMPHRRFRRPHWKRPGNRKPRQSRAFVCRGRESNPHAYGGTLILRRAGPFPASSRSSRFRVAEPVSLPARRVRFPPVSRRLLPACYPRTIRSPWASSRSCGVGYGVPSVPRRRQRRSVCTLSGRPSATSSAPSWGRAAFPECLPATTIHGANQYGVHR